MLLLVGLVDVAPQVRVRAFADAQARIEGDPALFGGSVCARHSGRGCAFRVGGELAHSRGFLGAAFGLPSSIMRGAPVSTRVETLCCSVWRLRRGGGAPAFASSIEMVARGYA